MKLTQQQRKEIIEKLRTLGMTEDKLNSYIEGDEFDDEVLYTVYHYPDKLEAAKDCLGGEEEYQFDLIMNP